MKKIAILFLIFSTQLYGQIYRFKSDTIYVDDLSSLSLYKGGAVYVDRSPNAATLLLDTTISHTRIDLFWTDNSDDETGFIIQKSIDGVNYTSIDSVNSNVTTYSSIELTPNTRYYYRILAYANSNATPSNVADGYTYHKETGRYLAALTTPLSYAQEGRINTLVDDLKDSLVIDSLAQFADDILVTANETTEASLRNLVKRSFDATAANSPTFTQFEGYVGGGTKYINANFNPTSDGVAYTRNSASFGYYSRTDLAGDMSDMGAVDAVWAYSNSRTAADAFGGRINDGAGFGYTNAASTGMFITSRTSSSTRAAYRNDATLGSSSQSSSGVPNLNFYVLGYNQNGSLAKMSTRQIAFVYIGKGVTAIEARKISNCVENYMDSIGKGMIASLTMDNTYLTLDNTQIKINDEY